MSRSTKEAWLEGPGDLKESEVKDVPVKGQTVKIRQLPSAYSARVSSEATSMILNPRGEQINRIDLDRMNVLKFAHGVVEPQFSEEEAKQVSERFADAFDRVIVAINELSGINDEEEVQKVKDRFPGVGGTEPASAPEENGKPESPGGSAGADVPIRDGGADAEERP